MGVSTCYYVRAREGGRFVCAREDVSAREGSVRVRGHKARCTCVQRMKCVRGGKDARVPSQHLTSHVPQPFSTGTFGPVLNHCTLDTTVVECVHARGKFCVLGEVSAREGSVRVRGHQARCTYVRGVKWVGGGGEI